MGNPSDDERCDLDDMGESSGGDTGAVAARRKTCTSCMGNETAGQWCVRSAYRLFIVALVGLAACAAGSDFKNLCALVGALSNGLVAFVLPPLIALRVLKHQLTAAERVTNALLLCFGIFGCSYSTFAVLGHMVRARG